MRPRAEGLTPSSATLPPPLSDPPLLSLFALEPGILAIMTPLLRVLVLMLYAAGFTASVPAANPTPPKPNFVFVLCDDLGYNDLGCYTYPSKAAPGPPPPPCPVDTNYLFLPAPNSAYSSTLPDNTLTPNLDRMAAAGVRFTSFYSGGPVCSPSRATLMTGCYPYRVGVNKVFSSSDTQGLHTSEISVAKILKTVGYATAAVGKWHLGHRTQFLPTRQGFDEYFGIPYSNDMSPQNLYENEAVLEAIGADGAKQALLTSRYTARALDFIDRNTNRPFFLYLAHNMPHVPVYASTNFAGRAEKAIITTC